MKGLPRQVLDNRRIDVNEVEDFGDKVASPVLSATGCIVTAACSVRPGRLADGVASRLVAVAMRV
jgi:hypothetical protein